MASRPAEFDAESRKDRTISNQAKEIERLRQQLAAAVPIVEFLRQRKSIFHCEALAYVQEMLAAYDAAKGGDDAGDR